MEEKITEGIILKNFEYRDCQRILTVFSKQEGVVNCIAKGKQTLSLTTPLIKVEWTFAASRSTDLYHFKDPSLLDPYEDLRKDYQFLEIAGKMISAILRSQFQGKPAPVLYDLFSLYLKTMPQFPRPIHLLLSFYLKLLNHDGLVNFQTICSKCQANNALCLYERQPLCPSCASPSALHFSNEEWSDLSKLTFSRQFAQLANLSISQVLEEKVSAFFAAIFS